MKHTVQRERTAFNVLLAAKDSANNIVDGICTAIVKAEQDTVIPVKIGTEELEKVNQYTDRHIKAQEQILENHRKKWPNASATTKASGCPTAGSYSCWLHKSSVTLQWSYGRCVNLEFLFAPKYKDKSLKTP